MARSDAQHADATLLARPTPASHGVKNCRLARSGGGHHRHAGAVDGEVERVRQPRSSSRGTTPL